jgi:NDP-sugar pyrophosphorylase family protein
MTHQLIEHALIMAAGRGNRMRPLTDSLPKSMVPFRQDTLIGNNLSMLNQNISFVHVTVGYKKAMLAEYLMKRGVDTVINTEGHGNAWWIQNTIMRYVNMPVLVLTTDNITELDFTFLNEEYERLGSPACMLVPVLPVPSIEGDYIKHESGLVTSVQRHNPSDIYCSGIQVLNPASVNSIAPPVDDFYMVWNALIADKQLKVSNTYPKDWFSVDTLEQLARLS